MVKKVIVLDVTEKQYTEGLAMLARAIQSAWVHGQWGGERSLEIFGEKGWLPPWEELEDLDTFIEKELYSRGGKYDIQH